MKPAASAAWRNQVGIAVVKKLSTQVHRGFWPYNLDLKQDQTLFSPVPSRSALSLYRPNRNDYVLEGIQEVLQTRWQTAERFFEKAASLDSGDPMAHFWLGVVQQRQGKKSQATANWARADALPFLLHLGAFYMREGSYGEAREWYQEAMAVARFPGVARTSEGGFGQAYRDLGKLEWDEGRIDQAVGYYESALDEIPDRTLFLYELAQLYSLQNRFDEAIPLIHTLMQIEPDAASWPSVLGTIHQLSDRLDLAEQAYLQALKTGADQNPEDRCWHARSWLGLSSVYAASQSWERSLTASIQAIQVNQGLSSGWQNQLRNNFESALMAMPKRRDWYLVVGDTYEQIGDTQSALDYFGRAAQLWPDSVEVQERLNDTPQNRTVTPGVCP